MAFSSEISGLFPNTSETFPQALKEDADKFSSETLDTVEQSVDKSISSLELKIDNSLGEVVESSKYSKILAILFCS